MLDLAADVAAITIEFWGPADAFHLGEDSFGERVALTRNCPREYPCFPSSEELSITWPPSAFQAKEPRADKISLSRAACGVAAAGCRLLAVELGYLVRRKHVSHLGVTRCRPRGLAPS